MQALTYYRYGSADELQIKEVDTLAPGDDEILIKVHAGQYALHEAPEAFRYLLEGHARGKIVIRL